MGMMGRQALSEPADAHLRDSEQLPLPDSQDDVRLPCASHPHHRPHPRTSLYTSPHVQEGNLIGVVNYLNILHYLVDFYSDPLSNYNFSIRELNVGSYDQVWDVREDAPLYEGLLNAPSLSV